MFEKDHCPACHALWEEYGNDPILLDLYARKLANPLWAGDKGIRAMRNNPDDQRRAKIERAYVRCVRRSFYSAPLKSTRHREGSENPEKVF
ncbi:MAG: hypothetical protein GEU81_15320 [Nitriliruptorales bacterium]|nr:hypothetical protein [Nitriliruptorales bacterium]